MSGLQQPLKGPPSKRPANDSPDDPFANDPNFVDDAVLAFISQAIENGNYDENSNRLLVNKHIEQQSSFLTSQSVNLLCSQNDALEREVIRLQRKLKVQEAGLPQNEPRHFNSNRRTKALMQTYFDEFLKKPNCNNDEIKYDLDSDTNDDVTTMTVINAINKLNLRTFNTAAMLKKCQAVRDCVGKYFCQSHNSKDSIDAFKYLVKSVECFCRKHRKFRSGDSSIRHAIVLLGLQFLDIAIDQLIVLDKDSIGLDTELVCLLIDCATECWVGLGSNEREDIELKRKIFAKCDEIFSRPCNQCLILRSVIRSLTYIPSPIPFSLLCCSQSQSSVQCIGYRISKWRSSVLNQKIDPKHRLEIAQYILTLICHVLFNPDKIRISSPHRMAYEQSSKCTAKCNCLVVLITQSIDMIYKITTSDGLTDFACSLYSRSCTQAHVRFNGIRNHPVYFVTVHHLVLVLRGLVRSSFGLLRGMMYCRNMMKILNRGLLMHLEKLIEVVMKYPIATQQVTGLLHLTECVYIYQTCKLLAMRPRKRKIAIG
ncbi:hypothetical protein ACOME3_004639 [Neoechinorhynchus agilis]